MPRAGPVGVSRSRRKAPVVMHCSDDALARLLADEEPDAATALHVRGCAVCRERLDALTLDGLLDDEDTWKLADEISGLDERLNRNAENARRTAEEDADAAERLGPDLPKPYRFGWTDFLRSRQYHTAGGGGGFFRCRYQNGVFGGPGR